MIKAEAHSDDRVVEVEFDATPWFNGASDKEILDLYFCDWGGDYPADNVALNTADENEELEKLFQYLALIKDKKDDSGFECHVDETTAIDWLKRHKPSLANRIQSLKVLAENGDEVELADGGCLELPEPGDGAIRRRDVHGNCEEIRKPDDPGYDDWLETLMRSMI